MDFLKLGIFKHILRHVEPHYLLTCGSGGTQVQTGPPGIQGPPGPPGPPGPAGATYWDGGFDDKGKGIAPNGNADLKFLDSLGATKTFTITADGYYVVWYTGKIYTADPTKEAWLDIAIRKNGVALFGAGKSSLHADVDTGAGAARSMRDISLMAIRFAAVAGEVITVRCHNNILSTASINVTQSTIMIFQVA